ncbi:MAG: cation diffusion facilitator family transporter [Candidatus Acetothermia bacterium]|nr:cation diffusion facilitator family transporter [Candidatus Acetothermia bacterium]MDH7505487.1 cation diffusion facilitator family transporter [Candidatus Acetothermia bacterium]
MTIQLTWAFAISATTFVLELVGGLLSSSLALLSDAGHVFADAVALGLSLFALRLAARPADAKATFGYHRVGIMVALVNGTTLIVIAALIFREAYQRFFAPPEIKTTELLAIAAVGLAANLAMALLLRRGRRASLNIKSAWLHVLGDGLGSLGVLASGVVILLTGWSYVDPLISVLIGGLIFIGGLRVIREAGAVLLELPPRGLDLEEVARAMESVPGVLDVHDLHVWAITPQLIALAAHVQVEDQPLAAAVEVCAALRERLRGLGIGHLTLQLECHGCAEGKTFCHLLEPLGESAAEP